MIGGHTGRSVGPRRANGLSPLLLLVLGTVSAFATGCTSAGGIPTVSPEPPTATPKETRFTGWVPTPSAEQVGLAECLASKGLRIEKTVGRFIVVADTRSATDGARASCRREETAYLTTITTVDHKVPDERGASFMVEVRSCMARFGVEPLADGVPIVVRSELVATRFSTFTSCVEEIRARPAPTD